LITIGSSFVLDRLNWPDSHEFLGLGDSDVPINRNRYNRCFWGYRIGRKCLKFPIRYRLFYSSFDNETDSNQHSTKLPD